MKRFKILSAFIVCLAVVFLNMPWPGDAYGAHQNRIPQHQNTFSKMAGDISKGIGTGVVWTVKAPYKVGKYVLTEIFRPFVPLRDKLIDMFGVEVQE